MIIVTGSDNNYVPGVMVLIASAAFHTPDAEFYVLDMGIMEENRTRIDALGPALGCSVRRIEISSDFFASLAVHRGHLTRGAYLRLLIPELFPGVDRAVYMDCDMVVMDDLSPLGDMDLCDFPIAAVPCPSPNDLELEAIGIARGEYINSGFLVMNLPVWRNEDIRGKCEKLLSDKDNPLISEDQSAINIVCRDRIVPLPSRYNVYADPNGYKRLEDVPVAPAVVHYVVNNKPWNRPTPLDAVWLYHADRIKDVMGNPRPAITWSHRVSLLNRRRKAWTGLLLRKPKYVMQRRVQQLMDHDIALAYLEKVAK